MIHYIQGAFRPYRLHPFMLENCFRFVIRSYTNWCSGLINEKEYLLRFNAGKGANIKQREYFPVCTSLFPKQTTYRSSTVKYWEQRYVFFNIMKKYKFPLQIVGKSMGRKQTLHINIIVQMVDMFYSGSDTKKINSLETNRHFDNLMGFWIVSMDGRDLSYGPNTYLS